MWGDKQQENNRKNKAKPKTNFAPTSKPTIATTAATQAQTTQNTHQEPVESVSKPRVASTIGQSLHVQGVMKSDEDVIVLGSFNGEIELKRNSLAIGRGGRVEANVIAKNVRVEGEVIGDVYAHQITILRTGTAIGNLNAPRVVIEDGAKFKGNIDMDNKTVEDKLGKTTESTAPATKTAVPDMKTTKPQTSQNEKAKS